MRLKKWSAVIDGLDAALAVVIARIAAAQDRGAPPAPELLRRADRLKGAKRQATERRRGAAYDDSAGAVARYAVVFRPTPAAPETSAGNDEKQEGDLWPIA